jgi:hypothetical protein
MRAGVGLSWPFGGYGNIYTSLTLLAMPSSRFWRLFRCMTTIRATKTDRLATRATVAQSKTASLASSAARTIHNTNQKKGTTP